MSEEVNKQQQSKRRHRKVQQRIVKRPEGEIIISKHVAF
jgi:hypothetical protein